MPTFIILNPSSIGGKEGEEGGKEELVRFSGCNKGKLESAVQGTCARVQAAGPEGAAVERKKEK